MPEIVTELPMYIPPVCARLCGELKANEKHGMTAGTTLCGAIGATVVESDEFRSIWIRGPRTDENGGQVCCRTLQVRAKLQAHNAGVTGSEPPEDTAELQAAYNRGALARQQRDMAISHLKSLGLTGNSYI